MGLLSRFVSAARSFIATPNGGRICHNALRRLGLLCSAKQTYFKETKNESGSLPTLCFYPATCRLRRSDKHNTTARDAPVEQPPVVPPPPVQPPPEDPNAVPYAGEWRVTYTSSESSNDTFTYALNITLNAPAESNLQNGGIGRAIECQSSVTCDYTTGAPTGGYGFISNIELDDGTAPLGVAIFDDTIGLFYFTTDTDNAVGTDDQGRQVLEGAGFWESSPEEYTSGLVTAVRVGDARTLQQAPTTPVAPTPPEEPDPPTNPDPPAPPEEPDPPTDPEPQPPAINSFSASSSSIETGDSVTLSWNVDNADSLRISPNVGTVMGSNITVRPSETTRYTLTATNSDGSDIANVRVTVQESAPPEPEEPALRYWVNTTCGKGVFITYATVDGGTEQRTVNGGYVYTVESGVRSGTFVYISAQNQCDSGDVTVRIYKRGNVFKQASSSGAYVIATASGSY